MGWVLVALSFVGLTYVVGNKPTDQHLTEWVQGNNLQHSSSESNQGVRGTVDRITTNATTGTRTVVLIADDGAPVKVVIMPTTDTSIPHSGDRIEASGSVLDTGTLVLQGQLKFLPPAVVSSRRKTWMGNLTDCERTTNGAHWGTLMLDGRYLGHALVQRGVSVAGITDDTTIMASGYVGSDGTLVIESISL